MFFWLILLAGFLFGLDRLLAQPSGQDSGDLLINEFMADNKTGLVDADGDYSDWIELYNRGSQAINLSGWFLSDDPQQPQKWAFPNVSLGGGQYLIVFASGKDRQSEQLGAELHTNFKLTQAGEFLGLYNVLENRLMDSLTPRYPQQYPDVSYGRVGDPPAFNYLAVPTPGGPNGATLAWAGALEPVKFSRPHGFYEQPLSVELSSDTPDTIIRYTVDGSTPAEDHGQIYTGPIPINQTTFVRVAAFKPNFRPAPVKTQTYIFLEQVLRQPQNPPGFPNTWGINIVDFAGSSKDTPVRADYEMDPRIVNDPRYGSSLKEGLKAIPTISIVTDAPNFDIYANPRMKGPSWERPASIEYFDPKGDDEGFQVNAGIRIQGGAGRWEFMPKHSFRLFFRDKYGAAKLRYPLFPDSPVAEFDTLVLRAGSDRSFAGHPDTGDQRLTTYTHDEWLRASQVAISGVGSHGRFVHLYLNGLYWGLYNVIERPDDAFLASYFGGEKEDWYVVNHSGTLSGSSDRFNELLNLAAAGGLADPARYELVKTYLDVTQFCDYLILQWYAGNTDWPQNNWYAAVQNPTGQVRYFVWDGELTWVEGAKTHTGQTNAVGLTNTIKPLFESLIQNPDFKILLADRVYRHLFNNGALTDANAQARWLRLANEVEPAIVAESARWGDARYDAPITPDDWRRARDHVLAQIEGNGAKLIGQLQELGYYPALEPPTFNQQGGLVEKGFTVSLTPLPSREGLGEGRNSTIYYTTDGSDPRQAVSGAAAPTALIYHDPLVLTATTQVKARSRAEDGAWSALNEATFKVVEQKSQLALTEFMYNPLGGNDYEFIELKNVGEGELHLAGMYFEDGLSYTFPPGVPPLAAGQYLVLVHNPTAFAGRYPEVAIGGVYQGKLSNQGEKLTLRAANGQVLLALDYDDENGWPLSPDGRGDSLVIIDPQADPANPQNWRASFNLYGSPGREE
ncbi:MAG: lamin tail domain-containing protein [Anaerolineae bacterium]